MIINIVCPKCGVSLQMPEEFAGREGTCPKCKIKFTPPALPRKAELPPLPPIEPPVLPKAQSALPPKVQPAPFIAKPPSTPPPPPSAPVPAIRSIPPISHSAAVSSTGGGFTPGGAIMAAEILLGLGIAVSILLETPLALWMLILVTAIWAGADAHWIKLREYKTRSGGGIGVFLGCLFLWIVFFPWYLMLKGKIARCELEPRSRT